MKRMSLMVLWAVFACHGAAPETGPVDAGHAATSTKLAFVKARSVRGLPLLDAPARVLGGPASVALVSVPLRGRIVRVLVRPGQRVKAGDAVVDVVMPELLQAAAAFSAAGTREAAWRGRRDQLSKLEAEGLARAAELAEVDVKLAEARSDRQLALAILRSAGMGPTDVLALQASNGVSHLRAPVEGVVTEVSAVPGELRDAVGGALARIEHAATARVEARLHQPPTEKDTFVLLAKPGSDVPLKLVGVSPSVDQRDGTWLAWFDPVGGTNLAPGRPGTVRRLLDDASGAVAVPATALQLNGAQARIAVKVADRIESRPVSVEALSGADAVVYGDVKVGEEVVSNAALLPARSEP